MSAELVGEVPLGVVTVTSTGPAAPAGLCAVIWVAELTTTLVLAVVPKCTAVAPVKFVPVRTTDVPPAAGPESRANKGGLRDDECPRTAGSKHKPSPAPP